MLYGPLSDAYGRRPVLLVGLGLYSAAGIACALAWSIHGLVAFRLAQALGGCAGLALGRAIVRDTADPEAVVRRLALMNLVLMVGPGLAPVVGGFVATAFGWRAIFGVLSVMGVVAFISTWWLLPETAVPTRRFSVAFLIADFRALARSRVYLGFTVGGGFTTTSIYAFLAVAPFVFVRELHRPVHEVGLYLGVLISGMAIGNATTARLIRSVPIERILVGGSLVALVSGLAFLAVAIGHWLSVGSVMATLFIFTIGAGAASPAALAKAMGSMPHLVGSAAGLYGFTQMAAGAAFTSLAAIGPDPAIAAAATMAAAALTGQVAVWTALRARRAGSGPASHAGMQR